MAISNEGIRKIYELKYKDRYIQRIIANKTRLSGSTISRYIGRFEEGEFKSVIGDVNYGPFSKEGGPTTETIDERAQYLGEKGDDDKVFEFKDVAERDEFLDWILESEAFRETRLPRHNSDLFIAIERDGDIYLKDNPWTGTRVENCLLNKTKVVKLNGTPLKLRNNNVQFKYNGEVGFGVIYINAEGFPILQNKFHGLESYGSLIKECQLFILEGKIEDNLFKELKLTSEPSPLLNVEEQLKDALATIEYLDGRLESVKRESERELVEGLQLKQQEIDNIKATTKETIRQNVSQIKNEWVAEQISKKAKLLKSSKAIVGAKVSDTLKNALSICYKTKQPALLMGPPGCGKNTILESLALTEGRKPEDVTIISITADMTKDSFLGHYVLDGDKTVWQDGPLASGLKAGKMIIIDEMNMAHADILAVLNNLTQVRGGELGTITLADNGGDIIVPHKDARIFATANPSTGNAGTKELNQATLSRFMTLDVSYLKERDEIGLLLGKFPEIPVDIIERIIGSASLARKSKDKKEISIDVGTRHLEKALMFIDNGLGVTDSITYGILNDCQVEADLFRMKTFFNIK